MIRSTFFGFGTAMSALNANQRALDATGNNIANMGTTGYTRQRLDLYSIPSSSARDRYAAQSNPAIGQGVNILGISQARDPFLDIRFRAEASNVGTIDAHLGSLSDITGVFDEVQAAKIQQALSDFRTQLQQYSLRTDEMEMDSIVRSSAEALTRLFNQFSRQLDTVRKEQEGDLEGNDVPRVNGILERIGILNQSIKECEIFGSPALEMKDERNLLLDELSAYVNIKVEYKPDPVTPSIENMVVSLVRDPSQLGNPPAKAEELELVNNNKVATLSVKKDSATQDWEFFSSNFQAVGSDGRPLFDGDGNPVLQEILFKDGAFRGVQDMLNSTGEFDSPANTMRGIGYYENMLDTLAGDFAKAFNDINNVAPVYEVDADGNPVQELYPNGNPVFEVDDAGNLVIGADGNPIPVYVVADDGKRPLFEASDGGTVINAGNIAISAGWLGSQYGLTIDKGGLGLDDDKNTSGANKNILDMIMLLDKKNSFTTEGLGSTVPGAKSLFSGTFAEFMANIATTAAQESSSKTSALSSRVSVLSGVEDLRDGISGVSMDEEGVNLLRFQKSYSAAARLMTTLDEAIDTIINKMGLVGR